MSLTIEREAISMPDPARLLAIHADLLPPELELERRQRSTERHVLAALVLLVVLLMASCGLSIWQTSWEQDTLSQAQSQSTRLTGQQRQYDGLVQTQAAITRVKGQLGTLTATDVPWYKFLPAIRHAAPAGVTVTGETVDLSASASSAVNVLPNTTGQAQVGTLAITGTAPDKTSVAAYVDALGAVAGLANPAVTTLSSNDSGYQFSIQALVTRAALGGRFVLPAGTK